MKLKILVLLIETNALIYSEFKMSAMGVSIIQIYYIPGGNEGLNGNAY